MKIANIELENRFALAPMAAVNCTAFRMLCKKNGAGLIYTQMFDCDFISSKTKGEIAKFLNFVESERPINVQLIGSNKENLIKSLKLIEDFADIIDFNMGCILPNQINKGAGAALLKDLDKIEELVCALVVNSKKPVTVKIRIGWDSQSINAVKVCRLLERCGVAGICIHGRTFEQRYGGKVNWSIMKQVRQLINIPIIANGDVTTYEQGLEMLEKTGCDMVMIGRESKHSPWVFDPDFVKTNENIKKQIFEFIDLYENYENRLHLNEIREHVFWMLRDFKTKENMKVVHKLKSLNEIKSFLRNLN